MCLWFMIKGDYLSKRNRNPGKVFHIVVEFDRCLLYLHIVIYFKMHSLLTAIHRFLKPKWLVQVTVTTFIITFINAHSLIFCFKPSNHYLCQIMFYNQLDLKTSASRRCIARPGEVFWKAFWLHCQNNKPDFHSDRLAVIFQPLALLWIYLNSCILTIKLWASTRYLLHGVPIS